MTNAPEIIVNLPLARLFPSALNPRKTFDDDKLAELADSIRTNGLIEPIVVRPKDSGGAEPAYEIVAGERRYRAAKLAGVERVAVAVRALDDAATAEVMLAENLQRTDLTPLEEAQAFHAWIASQAPAKKGERLNWPKQLGAKLGKSEDYIRERLVLLGLEDEACDAIAGGTLKLKDAVALARSGIDGEDRERLLDMVRHPEPYDDISEEVEMMVRNRKFKAEQARRKDEAAAAAPPSSDPPWLQAAKADQKRANAVQKKRRERHTAASTAAYAHLLQLEGAAFARAVTAAWSRSCNFDTAAAAARLLGCYDVGLGKVREEISRRGRSARKREELKAMLAALAVAAECGEDFPGWAKGATRAEEFCKRLKVEVPKEAPRAGKR